MLALLTAGTAAADGDAPEAGIAVAPLHPLCLDELDTVGVFRLEVPEFVRCDPALADIPVTVRQVQFGTLYYAERSRDEEGRGNGFIGYRIADMEWPADSPFAQPLILVVAQNGGGSGTFSSIQWLWPAPDGQGFRYLGHVSGGDRCNDGDLEIHMASDLEMIYSSAATPFRLLNPEDRRNHRMEPLLKILLKLEGEAGEEDDSTLFMGLQPYEDLENCAICCVGRIVTHIDLANDDHSTLGVIVEREYFDAATTNDDRRPVQVCAGEWLRQTTFPSEGRRDDGMIPLDEWLAGLARLEAMCGSVPAQ